MSRKHRRGGVRKETIRRQMRGRMLAHLDMGMAYVHKSDRETPNAFTHIVKQKIIDGAWNQNNRYT